ncbi:MAG: spore coat polysaccharide biosynthesis protein SpsF [Planctomycetota bacterium]|jgi:spore coat polysaccharide biosynthesis protein SpsF
MRTIALIQARMGSTRLPGKTLRKIKGKTLIEIMLNRLEKCKNIDKIIVATSSEENNNILEKHVKDLGYYCFRGSENDVLDRFYKAIEKEKCDYIVRLTADCPLIDPLLIDKVIQKTIDSDRDYGSNISPGKESFPDGQDTEVFKYKLLEDAWCKAKLSSEREHVTPYLRTNLGVLYTNMSYVNDINFSHIRMTVDTKEDFETIALLVNELGLFSSWADYTNFIIKQPEKFHNQDIIRNEGLQISLLNDKK